MKAKSHINTIGSRFQKESDCASNKIHSISIRDNRPQTVIQRKIGDSIRESSQKETRVAPAFANRSRKFENIADAMGAKYGVDTSQLKSIHNSSFPAKLHAEALIQGNQIHFGPGMDSDYNIRHEVAHAIDNSINGTPKGDRNINGYSIDTTREVIVDRMANDFNTVELQESTSNSQGSTIQRVSGFTNDSISKNQIIQRHGSIKDTPIKMQTYAEKIEQIEKSAKEELSNYGKDELYEKGMEIKKLQKNDYKDQNERYLVHRSQSRLSLQQCRMMVNNGILSGSLREEKTQKSKSKAKKAIVGLRNKYANVVTPEEELGGAPTIMELKKHQTSDYKSSNFVSTTAGDYIYGMSATKNDNKAFQQYFLLMMIELTDEDIVFDQVTLNNELNKQAGIKQKEGKVAFKSEAEISVAGGILPERIKWAYVIPMVDYDLENDSANDCMPGCFSFLS